jgi:hypothetical protein
MARPAAVCAHQIRATVLAMLAEAQMDLEHAPPTSDRFRKVVSVRKLRAPGRRRPGDALARAEHD